MTFNLRDVDLTRLNSLTKYPSIPTYHAMGERGRLTGDLNLIFERGALQYTEKIDGTNARIIFTPDARCVVGSREELLWADGDLIVNPTLGIVAALMPDLVRICFVTNVIFVIYAEVYGGKIGKGAKQYTGHRRSGVRVFDVLPIHDYAKLLELEREEISRWRDGGGQKFMSVDDMESTAKMLKLEVVPKLDPVRPLRGAPSVETTWGWMNETIDRTQCQLDDEAGGKAEGIVVRTLDRTKIAKLRFEDYERTLRRRGKTQK